MKPDEIDPDDAFLPPVSEDFALSEPPEDAAPTSLLRACWGAAKAGFRRVSYLTGPFCLAYIVFSLALMMFGIGSGRGWSFPTMTLKLGGAFLLSGLYGGILGVILFLFSRAIPRRIRSAVAGITHRPIPLFAGIGRMVGKILGFWPWIVGLPTFLILVTAFGLGVYAGKAVDRRLAEAIAAADRDDPYWRLDDLMAHREAVPDDENSALVVARALTLLPDGWPSREPAQPGTPRPPLSPAGEVSEQITKMAANLRLDDQSAAILRDDLAGHAEAVQIARSVANFRRGRHEVNFGPKNLFPLLKETQAARVAARLLAADAAIRAHDGDLDGALDSCRAILNVGRSIGDEPFLISQLVRIAIGGVALDSARRVMAQGEPSDAALARFQALVLDESTRPIMQNGLRGERATMTEMIRRIGDGEVSISSLTDGPDVPNPPFLTTGPSGKLWFDYQRAVAIDWMTQLVQISRRPHPDRPALWKAFEARFEAAKRRPFGIYLETLPLLLMPAIQAVGMADSRYQASLDTMAILVAAERQRRKTGRWPESIAAIESQFLANPPLDPFSGKPFLLDRRDGQLFVYSIGPNGRDQHGEYEPKRMYQGGADDVGYSAWDVPLRKQTLDQ